MIPRSLLYVPGDQPDKLSKAAGRGADALILDLEDVVAPGAKEYGRKTIREYLEVQDLDPRGVPQRWVRINPGRTGLDDITAVWHPSLTGVMVAKAETITDLQRIDELLGRLESAAGRLVGSTSVVPLLESAAAVGNAAKLARQDRVLRLQVGEADLASELSLTAEGGQQVLQTVRSTIILTSAAAGLEAPMAPVSFNFTDLDQLRTQTQMFAGMGFAGRACIHPAQIRVVNEVFTPPRMKLTEPLAWWSVSTSSSQQAMGSWLMRKARWSTRPWSGAPDAPLIAPTKHCPTGDNRSNKTGAEARRICAAIPVHTVHKRKSNDVTRR